MTRYRVEPDPNGYGFEVIAPDGRHVARARTCADATKLADGYEANVEMAQRNRQTRLTREAKRVMTAQDWHHLRGS
jgi:hypothetical protein